jgi:peroxiredoxin
LADYRDHYDEIRNEGAELVALSVEEPGRNEALRREHDLPFTILSDTEREMLPTWDLLNRWELGGIARPAHFVIGTDRTVRCGTVGKADRRVVAADVVRFLRYGIEPELCDLDQH